MLIWWLGRSAKCILFILSLLCVVLLFSCIGYTSLVIAYEKKEHQKFQKGEQVVEGIGLYIYARG